MENKKDTLAPLYYLEQIDSTNDAIVSYFTSSPCAVYSFNQTKGRGSYGKTWETAPGDALSYSFCRVIDSYIPAQSLELLNFHTAIVISEILDLYFNLNTEIKWPNDIIINNKKIGGILLEIKNHPHNKQKMLIFGIGLNLFRRPNPEMPNAGSISDCFSKNFSSEDFATFFHERFSQRIMEDLPPEEILAKLEARLFAKNKWMRFTHNSVDFQGKILGVTGEAELILEVRNENDSQILNFKRNSISMHY